ncbi:MAG: hypothetical protein JNJ71_01165 [Rubrivivax sp.]|nr:hypothetical protein [Rubrivivax sp.]
MRTLVVLLLLANALAFAWWQGHLAPLWEPPGASEREPQRLARQLRPEQVQPNLRPSAALPATAAAASASAASSPGAASAPAASASPPAGI